MGAPARHVSGRLYRKQILPGAVVDHPQRGRVQLDLAGIMQRFEAGAMDVVPFTLCDAANRHTDDVERVRGTVKRLEREGDQLYAVIEATDRGAALIAEQPRLPVSVRVKVAESGPHAGRQVLAHVAGTLDPVVRGMSSWRPVEASSAVLDFSAGAFAEPEFSQVRTAQSARAAAEATVAAWEGRPAAVPVEFSQPRDPGQAKLARETRPRSSCTGPASARPAERSPFGEQPQRPAVALL